MTDPVTTAAPGLSLIKRWEGLELESYQDIAGVWTIGYGHTETAGPGQIITEAEAEALLAQDLRAREDAVRRMVTAPLTQNKFDALVSLIYNIGVEAFRTSTVRRRINSGDTDAAIAEAWGWFCKARVDGKLREVDGLKNRRRAEIALWMTPEDTTDFEDAPDAGVVVEPGRSASVPPAADHAPDTAPPSITPPEASRRPGLFQRLARPFALKKKGSLFP